MYKFRRTICKQMSFYINGEIIFIRLVFAPVFAKFVWQHLSWFIVWNRLFRKGVLLYKSQIKQKWCCLNITICTDVPTMVHQRMNNLCTVVERSKSTFVTVYLDRHLQLLRYLLLEFHTYLPLPICFTHLSLSHVMMMM